MASPLFGLLYCMHNQRHALRCLKPAAIHTQCIAMHASDDGNHHAGLPLHATCAQHRNDA